MTRALGIDVGSSWIRIAEIESHGRSRRLVGLYEIPRDAAVTPGAQLRAFFESSGVTGDRIGLGTGATPLVIRSFEFPFGSLKKVEQAVRADFEDSLPFDIADHVLEVRPLGRAGRLHRFVGGLMAPEGLSGLDTVAEESGTILNSYYADVEALGQLALNQYLPAATTGAVYAVCDLGLTTTKIAFLRGANRRFLDRKAKETQPGELLEMRTINRGARELIDWIRNHNNLSEADAVQWLIHRAEMLTESPVENPDEPASASSLTEDVSDELKTALRPVVVDIYQTLQSFRVRTGDSPSAVYLTGGITGLKGLRDFLSSELRAPFHAWPIFEGFEGGAVPLTSERMRTFAVALALAHRWCHTPTGGWLNFKRMTAQRKLLSSTIARFAQPELRQIVGGVAAAAVAVVAYNLVGGWLLSQQSAKAQNDLVGEFRKIDRDLGKRAVKFAADPQRAAEIFRQEKKKRMADPAQSNAIPVSRARSEIFLDISETLPTEATLRELEIAGAESSLDVTSTFAMPSALTPEQVQKSREAMASTLKPRGYGDPKLEFSPSDPKTLVLKVRWKGASL